MGEMNVQLSNYENYARRIRRLLLFTGFWPGRKCDNLTYRAKPLIGALVCFTMSCFGLNFCREHSNNLNLVTKSLSIVVSFLTVIPKVVCFHVYHKDVVDLHRTLEKYFDESVADEDIRADIFNSLSIYSKPFFVLTTLLYLVTIRFILTPMITIILQLFNEVRPLNYILPYPAKFPWSFEGGSFLYYAHYIWEIIAGVYLPSTTSGVDSLFGYYAFRIRAIFRLMSHRMRNLNYNDKNRDIILRDCAAKHRILVKCCHQLQTIYGPIVFWTSLTSAIIMCALVFQAFKTPVWTVRYAIFTSAYILSKLLQAFMYAFYGSVIFTESENFREAVYSCGWSGSGEKSLMNNVLIMLCHKPIVLTACKVLTVSTELFTGILNTTISYFFLLQTLDEDK